MNYPLRARSIGYSLIRPLVRNSTRVIVAPLTTTQVTKVYPFEIKVEDGEAGVRQTSKVLLDQIRSVDKVRLGAKLGVLSAERVEALNRAIRLSLAV